MFVFEDVSGNFPLSTREHLVDHEVTPLRESSPILNDSTFYDEAQFGEFLDQAPADVKSGLCALDEFYILHTFAGSCGFPDPPTCPAPFANPWFFLEEDNAGKSAHAPQA